MRGTSSSASAVMLRAASRARRGTLREGASSARSAAPLGSLSTSAGVGGCTRQTSAASAKSAEASTKEAPADSYAESGKPARVPAPAWMRTSWPALTSRPALSGVRATRSSPGADSSGTAIRMAGKSSAKTGCRLVDRAVDSRRSARRDSTAHALHYPLHLLQMPSHVYNVNPEHVAEIEPDHRQWNRRRRHVQCTPVQRGCIVHLREHPAVALEEILHYAVARCAYWLERAGRPHLPRPLERRRDEVPEERGLPFARWRRGVGSSARDQRRQRLPIPLVDDAQMLEDFAYAPATLRRPSYEALRVERPRQDRKSTRLNSSHLVISYAV